MSKLHKNKHPKVVREFIKAEMERVWIEPFGYLYEYPLRQTLEEGDNRDISFDLENEITYKKLIACKLCYFDKEDLDYVLQHNWSYNTKSYARCGQTIPSRPLMHQYVCCDGIEDNFIYHHMNSDKTNNSLYNLIFISKEEHDEVYTPKIKKIRKYVKTLLEEYIDNKSGYKKSKIKERLSWFIIDILNKEIMQSLIIEIEDKDLLDRAKYRNDRVYRFEYNDKVKILYTDKLDALLEKIENNEFLYEVQGEDFNVTSLLHQQKATNLLMFECVEEQDLEKREDN